jgi:hypothetical protein
MTKGDAIVPAMPGQSGPPAMICGQLREAAHKPMTAAINRGGRSSRFKEPADSPIGESDGVFPSVWFTWPRRPG